ncbi:AAA family ATPase [Saccharicrinis sp. FJH2]|uniref:AAA family ATPase n=1 Tax=Saccharicrinis sp. FJH65 TaxID=3344659 RepID=UPI0035F41AF8
MAKIKIKNFGPINHGVIDNDGWLEFKKYTFFIGNQGSGKSTVAKVISTLSWLEKSINRGDTEKGNISFFSFKQYFDYQKIKKYFKDSTYIEYIGERYHIIYNEQNQDFPLFNKIENIDFHVPKIMYIPAERNILGTMNIFNSKDLPENLFTFAEELLKAQKSLKGKRINLNLNDLKYEYDEIDEISYIIGKDYKIEIFEASSGIQSFYPLYLVSKYLSESISNNEEISRKNMSVNQSVRMNNEIAELMLNNLMPENEKKTEIDKIRNKYYNRCFLNIVEEPELNLFPSSQWEMLNMLLEFNNLNKYNNILITTHSPYIINFLPLFVKAYKLYNNPKIVESFDKISSIIKKESCLNPKDLVIYEFNDVDGSIKKLENYNGLPSDENYLNDYLGDLNEKFIQLLEIEEKCL